MNILGIIPARGGSKGIPRKNLLKIGNETLLSKAIKTAKKSKYINRVICSTEDNELAQEAIDSGAEVPFKRPGELATDTADSWSVVRHTVEWLKDNESWVPEYVVLLQPTTPFRTEKHIDEAFRVMFQNKKQSCLSVRQSDYPPHWMFWLNENGSMELLYPEGAHIRRRQDAPTAWQPNGLIYIVSYELLFKNPVLPNKETMAFPMTWKDSINIDNIWQYELAKFFGEIQNI